MKYTMIASMALLFSNYPVAYADVLPLNQPHDDPYNTSAPHSPTTNAGSPFTPPDDLSKNIPSITPAEKEALLKKASSLNNEDLQKIARSFHKELTPKTNQGNAELPGVMATATAAPSSPDEPYFPKKTEKQKSIEQLKREQAFNLLLEDVMPLSPDQITRMHKYYDLTLQAKATPPTAPPTPQFTSTVVNLEPGSSAPVIRLAAGFVTSVLFVDSTGARWPITAYSVGDPQNFNIQWDQKSNTLFIQSLKVYAHGNMAVRLWGLDTPVVLTLVSGQKTVDFRVDLQVGGRGPDAAPPVIDTTFNAKVNPFLMNMLDGVPPKGSIKLHVSGNSGDAWLYDNKIFFRTKLTVLSPAWLSSVSSPDGTHVYEMMLTPYIVASRDGKTVDIKLSGL